MLPLGLIVLRPAEKYLDRLPETERKNIVAAAEVLRTGEPEAVRTKQLRGKVRELIVGHHRLTYFLLNNILYIVRGFRKKTAKTPKDEIAYAEKAYYLLQNNNKK